MSDSDRLSFLVKLILECMHREAVGDLATKLGHERQEQRRTTQNRELIDVHERFRRHPEPIKSG